MPISTERVPNRLLAGNELAEIMVKKFQKTLARDGMLTGRIAYGRVSFEIRYVMHLDNPAYPTHVGTSISADPSVQSIARGDDESKIESHPLAEPSEEAVVSAAEIEGKILSPNAARIEHDMPVFTTAKNADGVRVTVPVKYTGDAPAPEEVGNITKVTDKTAEEAESIAKKPRRARRIYSK